MNANATAPKSGLSMMLEIGLWYHRFEIIQKIGGIGIEPVSKDKKQGSSLFDELYRYCNQDVYEWPIYSYYDELSCWPAREQVERVAVAPPYAANKLTLQFYRQFGQDFGSRRETPSAARTKHPKPEELTCQIKDNLFTSTTKARSLPSTAPFSLEREDGRSKWKGRRTLPTKTTKWST